MKARRDRSKFFLCIQATNLNENIYLAFDFLITDR